MTGEGVVDNEVTNFTMASYDKVEMSPKRMRKSILKYSNNYMPPEFEVNERLQKQDFSTFESTSSKTHRRFFFFGEFETGKTSLWLRYIFYDQKRADLGVK